MYTPCTEDHLIKHPVLVELISASARSFSLSLMSACNASDRTSLEGPHRCSMVQWFFGRPLLGGHHFVIQGSPRLLVERERQGQLSKNMSMIVIVDVIRLSEA